MLSMSFIEELAKYAEDHRGNLSDNEAATKQSLVLPLIHELGYNTRDAMEVYPEFTADIGIKQGEKVDYAIMRGDEPIILVECKAVNKTLNTDVSQLYRYFSPTGARFGALTNGVVYRFFSDLKTANVMDQTPFWEVDIRSADEGDVARLRRFAKDSFDAAKIKAAAVETNIITGVKANIERMYDNPDDEFSKTLFRNVGVGDRAIEFATSHRELVKRAFHQFVGERSGTGSSGEFSQEEIAGASQSASEQAQAAVIPPSPSPGTPTDGWQSISDIQPETRAPAPKQMMFPNDDKPVSIRLWSGMVVEVVRWLTSNGHLDKSHCPIQYDASRHIVAAQPTHPNRKFTRPQEVNSLYVELRSYNAPDAANNARRVIERAGMDASQFKVRW